jgi:hypothetical protein
MYAKQQIKNKKIDIRYISSMEEIEHCNLLFISKSENNRIDKILSYTQNMPILTVCDDGRYAGKGVQIMLFVEGGFVRFEINADAIKQSRLYVSSLLLTMSKTSKKEEEK